MKLYTAGGSIANREACKELGVGLMMCDGWRDPSDYPFFAVDNGAYSAWSQGKRWNPATFMHILSRCAEELAAPDFVVLPDIVGGGVESLNLSFAWRKTLDITWPYMGFNWALAVQDGMTEEDVLRIGGLWDQLRDHISTIFVGGTMDWKLRTMNQWIAFAHERGMECPPYDKHYVGIIAAQYCVETKTLMSGTLPEDFVEANRVLSQLHKRLPHLTEAPKSLAYFEKVLTNKQVPKPVHETHTLVL